MIVTLPANMDEATGFGTPDGFFSDSMQRILAKETHHEAAVSEGLGSEVSRFTREEPESVRSILRQACELAAA